MLGLQQKAKKLKTAPFLGKLVHLSNSAQGTNVLIHVFHDQVQMGTQRHVQLPVLLKRRGSKCHKRNSVIHSLIVFWYINVLIHSILRTNSISTSSKKMASELKNSFVALFHDA